MFKTTQEFDAAMYDILAKVRDGQDYEDLLPKYDRADLMDALKHCLDKGLIEGLTVARTASGRIVADAQGQVRITREGLVLLGLRKIETDGLD